MGEATEDIGTLDKTPDETNSRSGKRRGAAIILVVVLCVAAALTYSFGKPRDGVKVVALTNGTFSRTVGSGVAVVDFWAEWCGPCRIQAPIMDALAKRHGTKITVGKVDVDSEESLSDRFGVQSIPTIIILKDGREAARYVGVTEEAELAKAVQQLL